MITITEKLLALNEKANTIARYNSNDIIYNIEQLNNYHTVTIGYRASCGSTDKTQNIYRIWLKAIKEINKQGIILKTENLKVDNSYATNRGGFWNSIRYKI